MKRTSIVESLESRQLLSFGQPDPTFGVTGRTTLEINNSGGATPAELLVDSSGRTITVSDGGIVRYTTIGKPDAGFGVNGVVTLSGLDVLDAAIDSSGRLNVLANGSAGTLVLRFTSAGKSDKPFGTNGAALVTSNKKFAAKALAIDSAGRFVIAGNLKNSTAQSSIAQVYRLTSAGAPDTSFDGDGLAAVQLATTDLLNTTPSDNVVNVSIGANDAINVLGGSQAFSPGGFDEDSHTSFDPTYGDAELDVARLNNGGSLDTSFAGGSGIARHTYLSGSPVAYTALAGATFPDGTFAVLNVKRNNQLIIDRFSAAGDFVREDSPAARRFVESFGFDMAGLSDGRIIIAGIENVQSDSRASIFTLNTDGSFGPSIRPSESDGTPIFSRYGGVQVASNGSSIVAAGSDLFSSFNQQVIKIDAGDVNDSPDHRAGGTTSDLAIDSTGATHLAYYDAAHGSLVYVLRDPSGLWGSPRTIDAKTKSGEQLSIAVDSHNRPTIAYYDGKNGDLKLAQFTAKKKWVLSLIDSKGTTGQNPSLAINPNTDQPAISYYYKNGTSLKFATIENGAWVFENVDAKKAGLFNSLMFTPKSKTPSIAYSDSAGNLKYATRPKAGKWSLTSVAEAVGASYVDLAYGGYYSRGAISYYNANTADLAVSTFDGSKWKTRTLASSGAQGQYTHIYAPYGSALYVTSYNRSKDRVDLIQTNWDDNTGNVTTTLDTSFGRYLSFAVDPSGNGFVIGGFDTSKSDLQLIDGSIVFS